MRYLPKSPAERQEMLAAIGAKSIDDLFSSNEPFKTVELGDGSKCLESRISSFKVKVRL